MGDIALAALSTFAIASLNVGFGADGLFSFDEIAIIANVGGITSVLQGGKFGHGFISAGIGAAVGGSRLLRGAKFGEQIAVRSVVGGTLSEITGGKFTNGAVTAAFAYAVAHGASKLLASRIGNFTDEGTPKERLKRFNQVKDEFGLNDNDIQFIDKYGVFEEGSNVAPQPFDTLDEALNYIDNAEFGVVRGLTDGFVFKDPNSGFFGLFMRDKITIYRTGVIGFEGSIAGIGDNLNLSAIDSTRLAIGHEIAHTRGIDRFGGLVPHPNANIEGLKLCQSVGGCNGL